MISPITALLSLSMTAAAGTMPTDPAPLPPLRAWSGESEELISPAGDRWITPAEAAGFRTTPTYRETADWLSRLARASEDLTLIEVGTSAGGRPILMVVAALGGGDSPEAITANGRPTVLVQAGIHAGEIDGNDAGMMLLRDLTVGGRLDLLQEVNLLFVPILNVDGHERASAHGRMNQRGPEITGWRTNALNLNLNRDYAKLDSPEIRAMAEVINAWDPDVYVDVHVTDGSDYQYDITWGWNDHVAWSPAASGWISQVLQPRVDEALTAAGHVPGRLVFEVDGRYPEKGLSHWTASPRFSHGYGDARHLPSILVENHSLKPFRRRVLGTYVLLREVLRTVAANASSLREAAARDRSSRPQEVPLDWGVAETPATIEFHAYETRTRLSPITGAPVVEYLESPRTYRVPYLLQTRVSASAVRPAAYLIPPEWQEVITRLRSHGIRMSVLTDPTERRVSMYRLRDAKLADTAFEGRIPLTTGFELLETTRIFPAGTVRISTDQPLGTLAMLLLEPASPDSFLRWGFFPSILHRTEYAEAYVMEPLARRMLEQDPELAREFERALNDDPELRASGPKRLEWFYKRTPWWDERWMLYPVAKEQ